MDLRFIMGVDLGFWDTAEGSPGRAVWFGGFTLVAAFVVVPLP